MNALEIILLIIAYTLLSISIFLEIICYKKNLENVETIALTSSLLLLIISLTISPLLDSTSNIEPTNLLTLFSMVLVGLTTPLNILSERRHNISPTWKKVLYAIAFLLMLLVLLSNFTTSLGFIQYAVVVFLVLTVTCSMILIRITKPQKRLVHMEKTERIFSVAFLIIVPLVLFFHFVLNEENHSLKIGFTLPLIFIFLSTSKIWDDLHRLSLLKSKIEPKEQHFKNFALTEREKEIATILTNGKTYKQISEELHISIPTVKTHASNIYKKCGVKNRSELMILLIN